MPTPANGIHADEITPVPLAAHEVDCWLKPTGQGAQLRKQVHDDLGSVHEKINTISNKQSATLGGIVLLAALLPLLMWLFNRPPQAQRAQTWQAFPAAQAADIGQNVTKEDP